MPEEMKQWIDLWIGSRASHIKGATITMHAVPWGSCWKIRFSVEPAVVESLLLYIRAPDTGDYQSGVNLLSELNQLVRWVLKLRHQLRKR